MKFVKRLAKESKNNERCPKTQAPTQAAERATDRPASQAHYSRKGLKPGDPLLTEQEMMEKFGVSRSVVREATKALDFLGIIEAVPSRGMVLDNFDFDRVSEYFGFHFALSDYPREQLYRGADGPGNGCAVLHDGER